MDRVKRKELAKELQCVVCGFHIRLAYLPQGYYEPVFQKVEAWNDDGTPAVLGQAFEYRYVGRSVRESRNPVQVFADAVRAAHDEAIRATREGE
jgi:hypothetical protein